MHRYRTAGVWGLAFGLVQLVAASLASAALPGDVNGDNRIDVADVVMATSFATGEATPSSAQRQAADVSPLAPGVPQGNGVVDVGDVVLLARAVNGEDVDGDGLPASVEAELGLSPVSLNSNGTGPPDAGEDADGDTLTNLVEVQQGSPPGIRNILDRNLNNVFIEGSAALSRGSGEPFIVTGFFLGVGVGSRLQIDPGVEIRFASGASLSVSQGAELVARGTPSLPIVLRSTQSPGTPGAWEGVTVQLFGGNTGVSMEHVEIRDAMVGIRFSNSDRDPTPRPVLVASCRLLNFSQSGIGADDFDGVLRDNVIEATGGLTSGIEIRGIASRPRSLTIAGNQVRGARQGIYLTDSSARVTGNRIENNLLGLVLDRSAALVDGANRITGNDVGIEMFSPAAAAIRGNVIMSNRINLSTGNTGPRDLGEGFLNAEGNFWGTADPLGVDATIADEPRGLGFGIFTLKQPVDFLPFLNADPASGGTLVPETGLMLGVLRATTGNRLVLPAGSRVTLLGETQVPAGLTLEVGSGVQIDATRNGAIGVKGTLRILGAPTAKVTLLPRVATVLWQGIQILPGSIGSLIENARIEGVTRAGGLRPGLIDVRGAELVIRNSELRSFSVPVLVTRREAALTYRDAATGRAENLQIDNTAQGRAGIGVLIENASPQILGSTIRDTAAGISVLGSASPMIGPGNVLTENDVGILLEGTQSPGGNPTPVINGNSIFANARPGFPVVNVKLINQFPSETTVVNLRGNFFGSTNAAAIRATLISESEIVFPIDFSGFLASAGGPPAAGSQVAFTTRIIFNGLTSVAFTPALGQTTTLRFALAQAASTVSVQVFNELDAARATLLRTLTVSSASAGPKTVVWNGRDDQNRLVTDGAYKFVVRAQFPDALEIFDPPVILAQAAGSPGVPPFVQTRFEPFRNQQLRISYSLEVSPEPRPARVTLVIRPNSTAGNLFETKSETEACRADGTCFFAFEDRLVTLGQSFFLFDGRAPNGAVLSGPTRLDFTVPVPIQLNAVVVRDSSPQLSGTSSAPDIQITSDPYLIVPSLDQVTRIAYCLDRTATVTMKLLRPGFSNPDDPAGVVHVFENRAMKSATSCAGGGQPHVASFGGNDDVANPMRIQVTEDGMYTFVIDAEDPGDATRRMRVRGVINFLRQATR